MGDSGSLQAMTHRVCCHVQEFLRGVALHLKRYDATASPHVLEELRLMMGAKVLSPRACMQSDDVHVDSCPDACVCHLSLRLCKSLVT